jgi:hypothetical protein
LPRLSPDVLRFDAPAPATAGVLGFQRVPEPLQFNDQRFALESPIMILRIVTPSRRAVFSVSR